MVKVLHLSLLKMDHMIYTGHLCICAGCLKRFRIDIIALDIGTDIQLRQVHCFLSGVPPERSGYQGLPFLGQEGTVHARSDIGCHHGGFNRKGSAAAEGIHQNPVSLPWCQTDQRCRKGLRDGSLHRHLPVAPLVERNSGCIDADHRHILHKGCTDRITLPVLREPFHMVDLLQPFHNGLLHDRLNIGRAEQFAFHRICLGDPEFPVHRNILFPGKRFCTFEKLVKGLRPHFPRLQEDSLGSTKENIRFGNSSGVRQECDLSVLHFGNLVSQVGDLSFQHSLHSKMAWRDQFISFHKILLFLLFMYFLWKFVHIGLHKLIFSSIFP